MMRYWRLLKNVSNWWLHIGLKVGLVAADPLHFRLRNSVTVEAPKRLMHEFKEIFMEECYTLALIEKIPEQPTIVDIGANVGFFSLFAASRFPGARILSLEPVPQNFRWLERNRSLNPQVHMTCIPEAVSGSTGSLTLYLDEKDALTTAATAVRETDSQAGTLRIPCTTLEELLDRHGISFCHFMKIDCEGSEYDILYTCSKSVLNRIGQMAIEVHRRDRPDHNIDSLQRFLSDKGFDTRRRGDILWSRRAQASQ